jgi:cell division protein FtsB
MIHRARLFFFVALAIAAVVLIANFPFGALLEGRSTVRADSAEVAKLQAANKQLSTQVQALHDPAVIGQIAHSEYGLTEPGERSVVVLPSSTKSPKTTRNPLAAGPVPPSDLLPSDAVLDPSLPGQAPAVREPGFWHRVLGSLEFWHSLF